jgi:hypothetical protein
MATRKDQLGMASMAGIGDEIRVVADSEGTRVVHQTIPPLVEDLDPGNLEVWRHFAVALTHVERVTKDSKANYGRYASLTAVMQEVKRVCDVEHLVVTQTPSGTVDTVTITTTIISTITGRRIQFDPLVISALPVPTITFKKIDGDPHVHVLDLPPSAQDIGGMITYGRRYALVTIFAMEVDDDDGQGASRRQQPIQERRWRTDEEGEIRRIIGGFGPEQQQLVVAAFNAQWGVIKDIPVEQHAEALEWLKSWIEQQSADSGL